MWYLFWMLFLGQTKQNRKPPQVAELLKVTKVWLFYRPDLNSMYALSRKSYHMFYANRAKTIDCVIFFSNLFLFGTVSWEKISGNLFLHWFFELVMTVYLKMVLFDDSVLHISLHCKLYLGQVEILLLRAAGKLNWLVLIQDVKMPVHTEVKSFLKLRSDIYELL